MTAEATFDQRFEAIRREWTSIMGGIAYREELALELADDGRMRDGRPRWLDLRGDTLASDLEALAALSPDWPEELHLRGALPSSFALLSSVRTLTIDARAPDGRRLAVDLRDLGASLPNVERLAVTAEEVVVGGGVTLAAVRHLRLDLFRAGDVFESDFFRRLTCPKLEALDYALFGFKGEWMLVDFVLRHAQIGSLHVRWLIAHELQRFLDRIRDDPAFARIAISYDPDVAPTRLTK